jgi:hypothetical protein
MQSESTLSVQHYTDPHCIQPGKLIHFACYFGALNSGILQIQKGARFQESQEYENFFRSSKFHFSVLRTGMQSE